MKLKLLSLVVVLTIIGNMAFCQTKSASLKIYFVRHGEKPPKGDNLSCQGENRALQLPAVVQKKIGTPDFTFIPMLTSSTSTTPSRMFQTVTPTAVIMNLKLNSTCSEKDSTKMAAALKACHGKVLVVWEHSAIASIVRALGVPNFTEKWKGEDFDSIWIVTIKNGVATFSKDKEGIKPSANCNF